MSIRAWHRSVLATWWDLGVLRPVEIGPEKFRERDKWDRWHPAFMFHGVRMTLRVTITNDDGPEIKTRVIEVFEGFPNRPRKMTIVPGGQLTTYLHDGNQILLTEKLLVENE